MYKSINWLALVATSFLFYSNFAYAVVVSPPVGATCSEMFNYNGEVYVCAEHPVLGKELHRINGDRYSTRVVKDIDPGPGGSGVKVFFESNGWLYFFAETTTTGYALWRTDGTEGGTKLVRRLPTGFSPVRVEAEIDGEFYISARSFDYRDTALIRTNGSHQGTFFIDASILTLPIGGPGGLYTLQTSYTVFNHNLFFITYGTLYKLVNNAVSVVSSDLGPHPYLLNKVVNNKMVIVGDSDGRLWLSDGTTANTNLFATVQPDSHVTVLNGKLLIKTVNDDNQSLVLVSDGAHQPLIIGNSLIDEDTLLNGIVASTENRITFSSTADNLDRTTRFISTDGSEENTKITQIEGVTWKISTHLNYIYVASIGGLKIFRYNPISGNKVLVHTSSNEISSIFVSSKGVMFSTCLPSCSPSGTQSNELWLINNSIETKLATYFPAFNHFYSPHMEGDRIYYHKGSGSYHKGPGIWHTKGTPQSTYQLHYRYDDGEPEPILEDPNFIVPILDLIMEEDEVEMPQ